MFPSLVYLCHFICMCGGIGVSTGRVGTLKRRAGFAQRNLDVCLLLVEWHRCESRNAVSGTLRRLQEGH